MLATWVLIQLITYTDPEAIIKACKGHAGCVAQHGDYCVVHVLQPQIGRRSDFEVIGHEFWHCFYPEFHK